MGVLRQIFGPSKEEAWRQLATEIGGDFITGGFWRGNKVQVRVKEWVITLDTFTVSTGKNQTTYTRLRAPYVNPDNFRFTIYRKSVFTPLGKLLGMQDIEVGQAEFDEAFVVKGSDPQKLKRLFGHETIRQLIEVQPRIYLSVKDDEGWFSSDFPEGVDELYFQTVGVIKDVERLKKLFTLFALTLNHLCHIGSAYENDPEIRLNLGSPPTKD